ncbi:hypothetical protein N7519_001763 [Penicillium mononematosum]|uniref:uncharacterized protein n=1 Tax=Penicillium mononematosum TaxID=268346 RepID=UPI0025468133|nr:uncharacterized protein N7519_001763 [Penicillium mononematosum]KAJ6186855.1 hypothetical protein N7519_001763 [Penicillium mononematosum]
MEIGSQFQKVHLLAFGGMSFIYQVGPGIVVKVPRNDDFAREQFLNEIQIYKAFSQHAACEFIVQCFYSTDGGIFLEHMRNGCLSARIQQNHTFDRTTWLVTHVDRLEPLYLRLAWMNDVTQAIAFLESLNLAHGDLRPGNIVLDGDRIKVTDFDNSAAFGTPVMICHEPWRRELRADEGDYNVPGCIGGLLGPRTEQFALGSIYYFINYGMEVYGFKSLTDNSRDRYLALRDLLQAMQLPDLDSDLMIDELIHKCWHNQFPTIASLAVATKALFTQRCSGEESNAVKEGTNIKQAIDGGESDGNSPIGKTAGNLTGCGASEKEFCQDLEKHGLFDFLRSK